MKIVEVWECIAGKLSLVYKNQITESAYLFVANNTRIVSVSPARDAIIRKDIIRFGEFKIYNISSTDKQLEDAYDIVQN